MVLRAHGVGVVIEDPVGEGVAMSVHALDAYSLTPAQDRELSAALVRAAEVLEGLSRVGRSTSNDRTLVRMDSRGCRSASQPWQDWEA